MKVGAAAAGDILVAKGRVLREYHHNLDAEEIKVLQRNGFFTGFLMPAWVGDPPLDAWPNRRIV